MATTTAKKSWGGIGDEAVKKATGCDWGRWFQCLDRAGCAGMTHKEIASLIHARWPTVGGWWSQMVTVGYEQARGRRARNQAAGGYRVSSSKTVAVPVKSLFRCWEDRKKRAAWLKDHRFTVRTATAPKSMRITWVDGKTSVEANFFAKGASKSVVSLEHSQLASSKDVARMRAYWGKALERMKATLEA